MSDVAAGDRASEQGRFAARSFVARWSRETGEVPSAVVTDRMLFAYEMGYLGGRGAFSLYVSRMIDQQPEPKQTEDPAQLAAREFVDRWSSEIGEVLSAVVTDRMLFAYEIGYLRGRSDAGRDALLMLDGRKRSDAESE